ncbi:CP family cyanate transporter-like MFS transporter [Psychrobacillus insolitus]|uniref:CP family cyanate transporter-like MFS transporter n=1 Tax=Psychrobacillus insolitus TaxID=1461 RepID=A0A2W7MI51_9BACI|nr:MFS transporter [Psychrobacillus insolitus]PZX02441.1 CP family cyanate transporter-like MFS transporter [Psychrobacillus insolitus]
MKKKYILMIIALFIASLNLRPSINSIAPLLETIRTSLGMNASVASLLTSIPVLCMGLFAPVAVKFSGKWGIERVLGWSLLVIGVGTILRFFTDSTSFLLITAFIAGIGIAFAGPLLPGFIKRHFPKHVPSMISIYTVALTLGAALSSSLIVPMQNSMNSWQSALGIWGVLAFVAVLLWWLFVMRHIRPQDNLASTGTKTRMPWTNKKAWLLTLTFGLMAMLFYSFTAWLPDIIQGMGYSKSYAASALTIFVVVQIPVSLVLPILLRKFPSRRLWLSVSALLQLVGLVMLASSIAPLVATFFIGLGAGGLFSLNILLPLDATENPQEAAAWSAMTQSVGYVIGATGPLILGWIHDATDSFSAAIAGLIVINVAMMVVQTVATTIKRKQQLE